MSRRIDVVIKFGGSAITDKDQFETLKSDQLAEAARCVLYCVQAGLTCLVVHGAGSFGHHTAREYQINQGLSYDLNEDEKKRKLHGFSLTRQSVTKLNTFVVDSLLNVGVPAVSYSPGTSWCVENRQAKAWPFSICQSYLEKGFVPVLHGDACVDSSLGISILSGDVIIKKICSTFEVKRVVFLTDVSGVYDRPPEEPGAQLIKEISLNGKGTIDARISTTQNVNDVTGGIKLKIETAADIVTTSQGKCPVYICAVNSEAAKKLCVGEDSLSDLNATVVCQKL